MPSITHDKHYSELIITFKIKMTYMTDVTGGYITFFLIFLFLTNMTTLHHPTPYTGIRGGGECSNQVSLQLLLDIQIYYFHCIQLLPNPWSLTSSTMKGA
jgi:hypothetical protein